MAILATKNPTLLDAAQRINPDGTAADVVELLQQTNEILLDMTALEANGPTTHRSSIRTGLPVAIWRQLYQGVPASKSTVAQVSDAIGQLEARAEVDEDLVDLNGNSAAFRLTEAQAFIESMSQTMAQTMFYGDSAANAERFTGLGPRYSSLSAGNGTNIIDGGGTGSDNTSVWLVVWGPSTVHGIYPKGSAAGIQHNDLGVGDAFDANGNRFRAYMDHWKWKLGLTLRDWRYVVRIANIDVSDLTGQTGTQAPTAVTHIINLMLRAIAKLPSTGRGRAVFYANRTVRSYLDVAAMNRSQNVLALMEAASQFETRFRGIPIRTADVILNTEARVV